MSTMGDAEVSQRLGEWAAEHGWGELETKLMAKAGGKVDYEPLLRYSEVMRPGNFEFENGVWRMEGTMEAPACILDPAGQVMWSRDWATRYTICQNIKTPQMRLESLRSTPSTGGIFFFNLFCLCGWTRSCHTIVCCIHNCPCRMRMSSSLWTVCTMLCIQFRCGLYAQSFVFPCGLYMHSKATPSFTMTPPSLKRQEYPFIAH